LVEISTGTLSAGATNSGFLSGSCLDNFGGNNSKLLDKNTTSDFRRKKK